MEDTTPGIVHLGEPLHQETFGALVGISQPAVSDLLSRGVLLFGDPLSAWLLSYTRHLRDQASGRGADGELARERARLSKEQADRVAMENAVARREVAPLAVLTLCLGKLAGDVSSILDALVPAVKRRVPDLSSEVLRVIEGELVKVRSLAANASLLDAESQDDDDDEA